MSIKHKLDRAKQLLSEGEYAELLLRAFRNVYGFKTLERNMKYLVLRRKYRSMLQNTHNNVRGGTTLSGGCGFRESIMLPTSARHV